MPTSKQLSDIGISDVNNLELHLQDIRGQGYNNLANMRDDQAGAQLE